MVFGKKPAKRIEEEDRLYASTIEAAAATGQMPALMEQLLAEAVALSASDIHLEPLQEEMVIRIRVDGFLQDVLVVNKDIEKKLLGHLKVKGEMDVTVSRIPQDGRWEALVEERVLHIRAATMPQVFGEKMVLRLFDKAKMLDIESLGFSEQNLATFKLMLEKHHGLVLLTGPTGSGKTTSLYAALNYLLSPNRNIVTVEDPVEFFMHRINQIQINPKAGLSFDTVLGAMLRQDPDIIMVGEIRDKETASIVVHAALTGHLVLSTLHTNDTVGAITRLIDIGIPPFLVASSLNGVVNQRLLKKLCKECAARMPPPREEFFEGKGCLVCKQTGSRGRLGVQEVMIMNNDLLYLILEEKTIDSLRLKETAIRTGMRTLEQDAMAKGQTGLLAYKEAASIGYY